MKKAKPFEDRRLADKSGMTGDCHVRICEGCAVRCTKSGDLR